MAACYVCSVVQSVSWVLGHALEGSECRLDSRIPSHPSKHCHVTLPLHVQAEAFGREEWVSTQDELAFFPSLTQGFTLNLVAD